jgi:hypothetical protein
MINITGDWTNISIMPAITTTITCYFWANDTNGNEKSTGPGYVLVLDNDPPSIQSGSNNFTVGTGNNFVIYSNFTDNINVVSATIYYRKINAGTYNFAGMTEGSEGQFYTTNIFLGIDTSTDLIGYFYYVIAKDGANNSVNYTYNETNNIPWSIGVLDDDPPTWQSGSGNFSVKVGNIFTIYANFTDNLGSNNVSNAKIFYKRASDINTFDVSMQKTGPGLFEVTNTTMNIDTYNDDSNYQYYLWVNDTINNSALYPGYFNYTINISDNVAPISTNGSGDFIAYTSTGFTIFANFSDNINVSSAKVNYAYEYNSTYRSAWMTESLVNDGYFYINNNSMKVNIYNNLTNLTYNVIAYDNSNNSVKYNDTGNSDWNITVLDDVGPMATNGSGSFFAFTRWPFIIYANFTDNFNVTRAVIHFKEQGQSGYCKTNMTPGDINGHFFVTSDNLSQASCIDPGKSVTPILYYVLAYDLFNNRGNYSGFQDDWIITILDNTPPQIINATGDFTTTTGEPFILFANFTDNINVSFADIYFKRKSTTGSSTEFTSVSMQRVIGQPGSYFVTGEYLGVDTFWDDRDILYYFEVQDNDGNKEVFRKPSGRDYKITIVDNDKPWFDTGVTNLTIGTGDRFDIFSNFTDNINVDFIRFIYRKESWDYWLSQDFEVVDIDSDKVWEFHIISSELDEPLETTNDESDYFYYIRVFDGNKLNPNVYNYSYGQNGFRITVLDDDPPVSTKQNKGSGDITGTTGEMFFIYANFTDNIKVESAYAYFKLDKTGEEWSPGFNMTETEGKAGKFYITNQDLGIDTTNDDSDYLYYVECKDPAENLFEYKKNDEPFKITIVDNDKPIAHAGNDQDVIEGTMVYLNANGSSDNIGIVSYTWTFNYDNLEQTLKGAQNNFKFETPGNYILILTIEDEAGNSEKDDIYVNVTEKNFPPEIKSFNPGEGEKVFSFKPLIPEISVQFNEKIMIKNIKDGVDFFYIKDSSGTPVEGKYSWSDFTFKLKFEPDSDLVYNEEYTATVTVGVEDEYGLALEGEKTWTFKTHPEDSENDGLGDNLPDQWEYENFQGLYGINQIGPTDDPDNDGFNNLEEYQANTHPNNPKSHPPIESDGTEETFNYFLWGAVLIIVILVLIILIVAILIFRKRKAEEEESKKPKPIEHEILFDEDRTGKPMLEPEQELLESEPSKYQDTIGRPPMTMMDTEIKLEPELDDTEDRDSALMEDEEEISEDVNVNNNDNVNDNDIDIEDIGELDSESQIDEQNKTSIQKGKQFYKEGDYSDAILEWQKVLEHDPDNPEVLGLIQNAMQKMKR